MKFWSDNWRNELKEKNEDAYLRLCECRNTKQDIILIANFMHKYNTHFSAKDCLIRTLEWIGDWNSQCDITDLTVEEFENFLAKIY